MTNEQKPRNIPPILIKNNIMLCFALSRYILISSLVLYKDLLIDLYIAIPKNNPALHIGGIIDITSSNPINAIILFLITAK